jgi:hypothetical protein
LEYWGWLTDLKSCGGKIHPGCEFGGIYPFNVRGWAPIRKYKFNSRFWTADFRLSYRLLVESVEMLAALLSGIAFA